MLGAISLSEVWANETRRKRNSNIALSATKIWNNYQNFDRNLTCS